MNIWRINHKRNTNAWLPNKRPKIVYDGGKIIKLKLNGSNEVDLPLSWILMTGNKKRVKKRIALHNSLVRI